MQNNENFIPADWDTQKPLLVEVGPIGGSNKYVRNQHKEMKKTYSSSNKCYLIVIILIVFLIVIAFLGTSIILKLPSVLSFTIYMISETPTNSSDYGGDTIYSTTVIPTRLYTTTVAATTEVTKTTTVFTTTVPTTTIPTTTVPTTVSTTTVPTTTVPSTTVPTTTVPTTTVTTTTVTTPSASTTTVPSTSIPTTTVPTTTVSHSASPCPNGYTFFNSTGFCYKPSVIPSEYAVAEQSCIDEGAHLASIHSLEENNFIAELYKNLVKASGYPVDILHQLTCMYIGLGYNKEERLWKWTDKTSVDYTNWGITEPNFMDHEFQTYMVLAKIEDWTPNGNEWNNVPNSNKAGFMCKKRPNQQ